MYVIESIRLRPKLNSLFPVIHAESKSELSLRGKARVLNDFEDWDAFIKKATGLDPSAVNVLNNPVFSGGSVNTGTRYNDREIILTLGSRSPFDLRKKISRTMALSSKLPLEFEATLLYDDGRVDHVFTDVYIKDVEAPIFDQVTDVVLTLSSPKPYFENYETRRRYSSLNMVAPDDRDGWITKKIGNSSYFYYQPSKLALKRYLSYNTPIDVELQFTPTVAKQIRSIQMMDIQGSSVSMSVRDPKEFVKTLSTSSNYVFEFKGSEKLVSCSNKDQFSTAVSRGWPEIIPTDTPLVVVVELDNSKTTLPLQTIVSWGYKMRMVGL